MAVAAEEYVALSKDVEALQGRVDKVEGRVDDSLLRIAAGEVIDARHDERFVTLCEKMNDVMETLEKWMQFVQMLFWKVVAAIGAVILIIITALIGFLFWYLQSIPKVI